MKLIESYLHEVGRYLPENERDDVLGELRSSLEEEVREYAGTDEPTRNQVEHVLNKFGHPINVASAYKDPRYLIGPELYPAFVDTLSTIFTVSLIAVFSLQILTWVTQGWATGFWSFAENVIQLSLWLVAITVISFATLEYFGERIGWYDNWKASSLSLKPAASFDRGDIVTNLVSEGIFLLWWNSVLVVQNWIPGWEKTVGIGLSDIWTPLFWPVNVIVSTWFLLHAFILLRRRWSRPALLTEIVLDGLALALCIYLIVQPDLVTTQVEFEGEILLERSIRVTIGVIAVIIAWDGLQSWRMWKK